MYCNGLKWAVLGSTGLYWEVLGCNWAKLCWTVVDCGEPMPLSISDRLPFKEKNGEEAIFYSALLQDDKKSFVVHV